jgi:hypothetical protein
VTTICPRGRSAPLPHAFDADLEVVEQRLCKTDELLSGLCNTHLPGIAGKQLDAQRRFDLLDSSRQRRLRQFQKARRRYETSILGNRQNGVELPRTQAGQGIARHGRPRCSSVCLTRLIQILE